MVLSILAGLMTPVIIALGVVLAARHLPRWSPTAGRGVSLGLGGVVDRPDAGQGQSMRCSRTQAISSGRPT